MQDKLHESPIVYSFGIGEDASFDLEMIKRYGAKVYAFDPTPKSIEWVSKQNWPKSFHFFPYGLSKKDGIERFYLPKNTSFVSGSISVESNNIDRENAVDVPMKNIRSIIEEMGHTYIDVLKMDIEGTEFDVLDDILALNCIGQICAEIHYFFYQDGKRRLSNFIKTMNNSGYMLAAKTEDMEVFTFVKC